MHWFCDYHKLLLDGESSNLPMKWNTSNYYLNIPEILRHLVINFGKHFSPVWFLFFLSTCECFQHLYTWTCEILNYSSIKNKKLWLMSIFIFRIGLIHQRKNLLAWSSRRWFWTFDKYSFDNVRKKSVWRFVYTKLSNMQYHVNLLSRRQKTH